MPTKRRRRLRFPALTGLTDAMREYLFAGRFPPSEKFVEPAQRDWWPVYHRSNDKAVIQADWTRVRDELLQAWIGERPGTRPWAWWQFDAPRWARHDLPPRVRDLGDVWLQWMAEPRRRLGGIGTPTYEVLNEAPSFHAGLPARWVTAWQESYYNGRARDIHGQPMGTEYHEGISRAWLRVRSIRRSMKARRPTCNGTAWCSSTSGIGCRQTRSRPR